MNGTARTLWLVALAVSGCAHGQASANYGSVIVTSDDPPSSCAKVGRVAVFSQGDGMREIKAAADQKGGNVVIVDSSIAEPAFVAGGQGYQLHLEGRAFKCPPEVVEASRAKSK